MAHVYVQSNTPNQWMEAQEWQRFILLHASMTSFQSCSNRSQNYMALTDTSSRLLDVTLSAMPRDTFDLDSFLDKVQADMVQILALTSSVPAKTSTPAPVPTPDQSVYTADPDSFLRFQLVDSIRARFVNLANSMHQILVTESFSTHPRYGQFLTMGFDVLSKTRDLFTSRDDIHLWKKLTNTFIQLRTLSPFRNDRGILCNLNTGTTRAFMISYLSQEEMSERYAHSGVQTLSPVEMEKMKRFA